MTAGNMADGISHGTNGQPEGECYAMQTDADVWKCGSKNSTATPTKNKPKCSEKLRAVWFHCLLRVQMNELRTIEAQRRGDRPAACGRFERPEEAVSIAKFGFELPDNLYSPVRSGGRGKLDRFSIGIMKALRRLRVFHGAAAGPSQARGERRGGKPNAHAANSNGGSVAQYV